MNGQAFGAALKHSLGWLDQSWIGKHKHRAFQTQFQSGCKDSITGKAFAVKFMTNRAKAYGKIWPGMQLNSP